MDNHYHPPDEPRDRDALPEDLAAVHARLSADAARWQSRVPAPDDLLRWLDGEATRSAHAQISRLGGVSYTPADRTRAQAGLSGPSHAPSARHRAQSLAAVLAAVVVVALLAGVLAQLGRGRGTSRRQVLPTATPLVVRHAQNPHDVPRGVWTPLPRLAFATQSMNSAGQVALAPSDPRVVYEASLNAASTGSLRRTRDGGASWTALAIPSTRSTLVDIAVQVSPLDANIVYLTLTDKTAPDPGASCPEMGPGAMLPCGLAYISTDAGGHWGRLTLPVPGVFSAPLAPMPAMGGLFQTQETRIYTLAGCGAMCGGPGSGQLVRSDDGGRTWRQADRDLARVTYECAFAAAPTGTTVFAITSTQGCDNESTPALALWRSDDAGDHWSDVTNALPGNDLLGMIATAQPGTTMPLLYLNLGQASAASHQITAQLTPASMLASADGGKTWQAAPLAGAPDTATAVAGPLAALPDGTVVAFQYLGDGNGRITSAILLGWKRGQPAWHAVASPLPSPPTQLVLTTYGDGQLALWAVAGAASRAGTTATYGVTEFLP